MLNDVVAKYKKLMCSFMSLAGLPYNRMIECSAKGNLHEDTNWSMHCILEHACQKEDKKFNGGKREYGNFK